MADVGTVLPKTVIRVIRGDTFEDLKVRWLDADADPIPIASARLQFRESADDEDVLLALTGGSGLDLSVAGEIAISLTAAQTASLPSGAKWDLEATSTAGKIKTLATGSIKIAKDVSHA